MDNENLNELDEVPNPRPTKEEQLAFIETLRERSAERNVRLKALIAEIQAELGIDDDSQ